MNADSPIDRRWKYPAVPSLIRRQFKRPSPAQIAELAKFGIPDICDAVGDMYAVRGIRPFYTPITSIAGPAVTVKCPPGDNLGVKLALTMVQPGDILVIDAQGFTDWCLGGFQMLTKPIRERGLSGLVVYGAYRDVLEAREAGFPIFASGVAASSGPKIGPCEINVPVCCGGVIVHPGDVVTASEEGVAVVPAAYLPTVNERLAANRAKITAGSGAAAEKAFNDYLDRTAALGLVEKLD